MSVSSQATIQPTIIDNRSSKARPGHRRPHARRLKAWASVIAETQPADVVAWASSKRPIPLSAAEVGVPLETTPWSFWLVLRLGEAMLAAGVIGAGWGVWQVATAVGEKLAIVVGG